MLNNTKNSMRALFIDTIQKEMRSKTLITLFVLSTVGMYFTYQVTKALSGSLEGDGSMVTSMLGNFSFSAMFYVNNLISILVAAILGTSAFRSDFREKISYTLLTLPISRMEYFYTRVMGVWVMSLAYYLYTFVLGTFFLSLLHKKMSFSFHLGVVFIFSAITLFILLNISSFIALYFNQLLSVFLTIIIYIFMSSAWSTFVSDSHNFSLSLLGFFGYIKGIFYLFFPHVSLYQSLNASMLLAEKPFSDFAIYNWLFEVPHLVLSVGLMVFVTRHFLNRKDF